jgi:hypothetical protein
MNELNHKIEETLQIFEALGTIEPTTAWQQTVIDRLATTPRNADAPFSTKALLGLGLLFVALNVGFILKETAAIETPPRSETSPTLDNERATGFETISKELFINPSSINR